MKIDQALLWDLDMSVGIEMEKEILTVVVIHKLKEEYGKKHNLPGIYVEESVSNLINMKKKVEACEKVGHSWVDESYGGPNSGCIAGYCKKCGYSFHTQLY